MDAASSLSLFNLAPLGRVALVGALCALGPLAWLMWSQKTGQQKSFWTALTVTTAFLTFDLIMFGSYTRLTDSGLGCPDWPGCYGQASPLAAMSDITAAHEALPTGAVSESKAWIEMVHRYLATAVGALIVLAWLGALFKRREQRDGRTVREGRDRFLTTLTLLWVLVQGAFGAFTVTLKLLPAIVTLHLLGGIVLLALLVLQMAKQRSAPAPFLSRRMKVGLGAALVLVTLQVLLGGWVSTNYAVLICNTFPQCQGAWWPEMNFQAGFEIWRPLGMDSNGQPLVFSALTAIHYTHRLVAYSVFAFVGFMAWRLARYERRAARVLGALLGLQALTGLSNVVLGWPLLAAVMHTGGAAALVAVLVWCLGVPRLNDKSTTK